MYLPHSQVRIFSAASSAVVLPSVAFWRHCKGELIFFHISSVQRLRDLQSSCRRIIKLGFVLICKCSVFGGDVCYFQFTFQVIRYCDLQCRLMSVDRHSCHLSIRKRIFFHCVTEFFVLVPSCPAAAPFISSSVNRIFPKPNRTASPAFALSDVTVIVFVPSAAASSAAGAPSCGVMVNVKLVCS